MNRLDLDQKFQHLMDLESLKADYFEELQFICDNRFMNFGPSGKFWSDKAKSQFLRLGAALFGTPTVEAINEYIPSKADKQEFAVWRCRNTACDLNQHTNWKKECEPETFERLGGRGCVSVLPGAPNPFYSVGSTVESRSQMQCPTCKGSLHPGDVHIINPSDPRTHNFSSIKWEPYFMAHVDPEDVESDDDESEGE